jgi:endonuclease/exonuclease/phosphatase family metal-dependent hydrolase
VGDGVFRVVQLNAGSLLEPRWTDRRHEVVAWLARLVPDVVCLQEIWEDAKTANTAGWLAGELERAAASGDGGDGPWHWEFGGSPFGTRVWPDPTLRFGSAVLSRWPIDQVTYHRLPVEGSDEPFVVDVPWEVLHARTAGVDVFSCHLAAAPIDAPQRRLQVVALDEIVQAGRDPASPLPAIVAGDFNAEPDSDEIRFLCGFTSLDGRTTFYQDAWRVAGDGPGFTQDWRTNRMAAAMNVHRKRIDYVFVGDSWSRPGGAGRVVSATLAFHEPLTGLLASDHAGLVVDLLWPDRPG